MEKDIYQLSFAISKHLTENGLSISCAESCTGGGVAYYLTQVPGSSRWFERSYVTYSNEAKQQMLGVNRSTLVEHGAVSLTTVEEMAQGCCQAADADIAIAISGIAGPGGGSDEKPVGLVCFGLVYKGQIHSRQHIFAGDRQDVRLQAIYFVLNWVNEVFN